MLSKNLDRFRHAHGCFFVVVFLQARAGQVSETVPVLNSDKATTWTITNYMYNNSNENQFTPYKPQGCYFAFIAKTTVYLTTTCQTVVSVCKR